MLITRRNLCRKLLAIPVAAGFLGCGKASSPDWTNKITVHMSNEDHHSYAVAVYENPPESVTVPAGSTGHPATSAGRLHVPTDFSKSFTVVVTNLATQVVVQKGSTTLNEITLFTQKPLFFSAITVTITVSTNKQVFVELAAEAQS